MKSTLTAYRVRSLATASLAVGLAAVLAGCQPTARTGQSAGGAPLRGVQDKGEFVVSGVPEIRPDVRERMLQYLNVRSAMILDTNDDRQPLGEVLIATRFGNTAQLHKVTQPGGARSQLTFFDEPVSRARFVPGSNGGRILFLRDAGGSEEFQVYHLDVATGRSQMLTDGKGQHGSLIVSRDGRRAAFYGTGRNGKDYDTYLLDLSSDTKPRVIYQGSGAVSPVAFSPDGSQIILSEFVSAKETHLHQLDVSTGKVSPITPPGEQVACDHAVFSADGKSIYYACDRGGEFKTLRRRDLASGREDNITAQLPWDIEEIAVSPTGDAVAFAANEDGLSKLYRLDPPNSLSYAPIAMPFDGIIGGMRFNHAGTHLCLSIGSAAMPGDVFTLPVSAFGSATSGLTRWTFSETGGIDPQRFTVPTQIQYPTFDTVHGRQRMIPAYYYRPRGKEPFPVLIIVHGGPEAQARPSFSGFTQYLVNELGIAVIVPNIRGSTGYGRTYHMLDDGMKREDAVRDIGKLLVWIALQGELDSHRVGIYGGSYGGYVVLAALATFPTRFKAGIDIVGIANFITFLERTRDYRRDLRRREYGDEQDAAMREYLVKISPLNNAQNITAALFVQHGQNDPRVPLHEAEQIVARQQAAGRPVWYFMAKGEGHGFRKRTNSDASQVLAAMFLEENLLK
jgi:dipeptidyl aminopeptidase/acylaminoacyl peptidase